MPEWPSSSSASAGSPTHPPCGRAVSGLLFPCHSGPDPHRSVVLCLRWPLALEPPGGPAWACVHAHSAARPGAACVFRPRARSLAGGVPALPSPGVAVLALGFQKQPQHGVPRGAAVQGSASCPAAPVSLSRARGLGRCRVASVLDVPMQRSLLCGTAGGPPQWVPAARTAPLWDSFRLPFR